MVADWKKYKNIPMIAGLNYYCVYENGDVVGKKYSSKSGITIDTYANELVNKNTFGDKAGAILTDVLRSYPFPVFEGEKFLAEDVVWHAISRDGFKLAFVSKGIYVCEYMDGGLTKLGRKYRLQNPIGTMEHAKAFFYKDIKWKIRAKYMLLYSATRPFAHISVRDAAKNIPYKFLYAISIIPGKLIALYWKIKYSL